MFGIMNAMKIDELKSDLEYARKENARLERAIEEVRHDNRMGRAELESASKLQRLELESKHKMEIAELTQKHRLETAEKEDQIAKIAERAVRFERNKNAELEKQIAVMKKELELTQKLLDTDADIVDVKNLVSELLNKLPEVKINSLSFTGVSPETTKK